MTRNTWLRPLRGGINFSTSSVNSNRPTLSLLRMAEKASTEAISAASSRLDCAREPNKPEPLTSTTSMSVSSRSSTNFLMNGWFIRAVTFQSIARTSSPGWYSRTSSKFMPCPLKTLWYWPASVSVTTRFVRISICRIFLRISRGIIFEKFVLPPACRQNASATVRNSLRANCYAEKIIQSRNASRCLAANGTPVFPQRAVQHRKSGCLRLPGPQPNPCDVPNVRDAPPNEQRHLPNRISPQLSEKAIPDTQLCEGRKLE